MIRDETGVRTASERCDVRAGDVGEHALVSGCLRRGEQLMHAVRHDSQLPEGDERVGPLDERLALLEVREQSTRDRVERALLVVTNEPLGVHAFTILALCDVERRYAPLAKPHPLGHLNRIAPCRAGQLFVESRELSRLGGPHHNRDLRRGPRRSMPELCAKTEGGGGRPKPAAKLAKGFTCTGSPSRVEQLYELGAGHRRILAHRRAVQPRPESPLTATVAISARPEV
jgi:hypothetical protein